MIIINLATTIIFLIGFPWYLRYLWYRAHTVVLTAPGRLIAVQLMQTSLMADWARATAILDTIVNQSCSKNECWTLHFVTGVCIVFLNLGLGLGLPSEASAGSAASSSSGSSGSSSGSVTSAFYVPPVAAAGYVDMLDQDYDGQSFGPYPNGKAEIFLRVPAFERAVARNYARRMQRRHMKRPVGTSPYSNKRYKYLASNALIVNPPKGFYITGIETRRTPPQFIRNQEVNRRYSRLFAVEITYTAINGRAIGTYNN